MKNKFLIVLVVLLAVMWGVLLTYSYQPPTELKQQTGIVAKINQHDQKWYDNIFGYSNGSYFNVRLEDNSYFEATGVSYDNIDRRLFHELKEGEEITISYSESDHKIYAIEYNGKTYLSYDTVLNDYEQNTKIGHIVGPFTVFFSLVAGVVLFIINCKRNYQG